MSRQRDPNLTRKKPIPPRQKPRKDWREAFLASLRLDANVSGACSAAHISRPVAYAARNNEPEFAAAWDAAKTMGLKVLEDIAIERAQSSSDTLLIFLMKAHDPARYRDTVRNEHAGDPDNPLRIVVERKDTPRGNDQD